MEFFTRSTNFDFIKQGWKIGLLAFTLWSLSLSAIWLKGLNLSLEFTGGTEVEARFADSITIEEIKAKLSNELGNIKVQYYGSSKDVLLRASSKVNLEQILLANFQDISLRKVEFVGSEVGQELIERGGVAIIIAVLGTMLYIALRFETKLAISAAVALLHDIPIILGVFAWWQIEFDLATLASLLAVLGYSLNDTIVVFDRVRENFRRRLKGSAREIMNMSINQTLSRTIMTSLLTMLVVLSLLFYGGESLFGFALSFCIGIVVGTFSSIFVAGNLAYKLGLSRQDLQVKPKITEQ